MDRVRLISNGVLGAALVLLAFAILTRSDIPLAEGQAMTQQNEGVITVTSQSAGGPSASFLLWVIDANRKRMSVYQFEGNGIRIIGARNFAYDLEPEELPKGDKEWAVGKFKEAYREQFVANPKNKGQQPPESLMKDAGPGLSTPGKLLAVAGVSPKGSGQEHFLWLVESGAKRIACYSPEGNRGIRLLAIRSYIYDHEFELEYPPDKSSPNNVGALQKAFEDHEKKVGEKDKGNEPAAPKGGGS